MASLQLWRSFHRRQVGAFARKVQHQFLTQGSMCHFTAAETNGDFYFIAGLQEFTRGVKLKADIVFTDTDTELDFFGFHNFLVFTGFFFT